MIQRTLRTLSSLVLLAAVGAFTAQPCAAADFSSSDTSDGGLTHVHRQIQRLNGQLTSVKSAVAAEFVTLQNLETRIRDRVDLKTVPGELQLSTIRIKSMDDQVTKLEISAIAVGGEIQKIRNAALRRRDIQTVRAADHAMGLLGQLQSNIKLVDEDVAFARDTVNRLWNMLR